MAFEGDLSNLQLGDIFQTLAMTRQTGTFVVRGREERRISFTERGIALLSARPSLGRWVARHLHGTGKVTQEELDAALEAVRRRPDEFVGDALLAAGACDEGDLLRSKRYVAAEEIYDLFAWSEGHFEFLAGEMESGGPFSDVSFDVGSIAMEAARRLDERQLLEGQVPEDALLTRAVDEAPDDLSADELAVFQALDGTRTLTGLAEVHHLGAFDILRAGHALLSKELVRPTEIGEVVARAEEAASLRSYDDAARLLEAACGMAPHDLELRERIAEVLVKAGEKRAAAAHLIQAGFMHLAEQDHTAALEAFKRALRWDNGNPEAHAGRMRAFVELGDTEKGLDAARQAAARWVALGDHRAAITVARDGLDHAPGDVPLRMALANALIGHGDQVGALATLDELAQLLESAGDDRRLLEVCRNILQLDPERREVARRIEELQEADRLRRRRIARLVGAAAGVLLLAGLAVPMVSGPSTQSQLHEMGALIESGDLAAATAMLDELRNRELTEDEAFELNGLAARIETPRSSADDEAVQEFGRRLSGLYSEASTSMQERRFDVALSQLEQTTALLDSPEFRQAQARHGSAVAELRAEARREIQLALEMMARDLDQLSGKLLGRSESFTEEVFRKEEEAMLRSLAESAEASARLADSLDWSALTGRVTALSQAAGVQAPDLLGRIERSSQRVAESCQTIAEGGERARALLHKHDLKNAFYEVRRNGQVLIHDGRLEQAQTKFTQFLARCDELLRAHPTELYEPIREELLQGLDLDGRIRERQELIEHVLRRERSADGALEAGDLESAYRIRATLVAEHPAIDFSKRFRLPLRVVSYPAGASVHRISGDGEERELGRTPLTVECDLRGNTMFVVRRSGFEPHYVEREGAEDDRGGRAEVELVKRTRWRSATGGTTEAVPAVARDRVLIADRSGSIRALSLEDGTETGVFETRLLGGVSGGVAIVGERVHVPTLDGICFVLDLDSLEEVTRYLLNGAGRAAPLVLDGTVLVADEGGVLRRVAADGRELWRQEVGKTRSAPVADGVQLHTINSDGELVTVHGGTGNRVGEPVHLGHHPIWTRLLVADGAAYAASRGGDLVRVDLSTRQVAWTRDVGTPVDARPCVCGGRLMVVTADGGLMVLDPATGELLDRRLLGGRVEADLVAHEEGFLVATRSGRLHDLDASGRRRWVLDLGLPVSSTPVLVDGRTLVVTRNGATILLER